MVELFEVCEFVRNHIIDDWQRQMDQTPVQPYMTTRTAATPSGACGGQAPAHWNAGVLLFELCQTLYEECAGLPLQGSNLDGRQRVGSRLSVRRRVRARLQRTWDQAGVPFLKFAQYPVGLTAQGRFNIA